MLPQVASSYNLRTQISYIIYDATQVVQFMGMTVPTNKTLKLVFG